MVKHREERKRNLLQTTIKVLETRFVVFIVMSLCKHVNEECFWSLWTKNRNQDNEILFSYPDCYLVQLSNYWWSCVKFTIVSNKNNMHYFLDMLQKTLMVNYCINVMNYSNKDKCKTTNHLFRVQIIIYETKELGYFFFDLIYCSQSSLTVQLI